MSAFGMNNRPRSTHTRRMRFSGPLTGVLCKRPFPEFVAKIRIQRQRSSTDIYRSCEQNCNRPDAFKNATVRERPNSDGRTLRTQTLLRTVIPTVELNGNTASALGCAC